MASIIALTGWGSTAVLLVLLGLSVWSVRIILDRRKVFLTKLNNQDFNEFKKLIQEKSWEGLKNKTTQKDSLLAGSLHAALEIKGAPAENIDRAIRSYMAEKRNELEKGLSVLATLGSNAPFIGLFGTVLGIIQAFGVLANQQTAGASSVMGSLSEALIATAVGLFVAIPALVAFNYFSRELKVALASCESLRDLFISRL